jgi:hypothetical protein
LAKTSRTPQTVETKIEAFAEDLGRLLGTARAKADHWLGQRREIAKHLTDIRDTASHLLTQIGDQANALKRKPAAQYAPAPVSRKKRRKMSAKARAAISAAQKARWAKQKAGEKKKG